MWKIESSDEYEKKQRFYEKKHWNELAAVLTNLDRLVRALQAGGKLSQIKFGFLRLEPKGVYRISEQGGGKGLQATRLYLFPDEKLETLHLLLLGDKASQSDDIQSCKRWVEGFLSDD